jgi:hypothetical protein
MKILLSLLSLSAVFAFSSCQQRMYFPDRVNTPGFTAANQASLTLSAKVNGNNNFKDDSIHKTSTFSPAIDAAYAVTDNVGLIFSYRSLLNRYVKERTDDDLSGDTVMGGVFNGSRVEGGVGYFTKMGGSGRFELYGGFGLGHIERKGTLFPQFDYSSKYYRLFLQAGLGFDKNDRFSLTGGFRLTGQKYYDFESGDPSLRYHIATINKIGMRQDVTKPLYMCAEPFINMEMGYKFIKFNLQGGGTIPLNAAGVTGNTPFYFSFGLAFHYSPEYFKSE